MYSNKVMEHFKSPHNVGEIPDADGVGKVGNPVCGDLMYIYIKVKDDVIIDIKFKTFGCGAAIATSSMITELAKGKTLEQAEKISRGDVAEALDGLPPVKMHCSNLAADGLKAAIEDYRAKKSGKKTDGVRVDACTTCGHGENEFCHSDGHVHGHDHEHEHEHEHGHDGEEEGEEDEHEHEHDEESNED
jgi:nitrogen fixation protein NifU and related proteins